MPRDSGQYGVGDNLTYDSPYVTASAQVAARIDEHARGSRLRAYTQTWQYADSDVPINAVAKGYVTNALVGFRAPLRMYAPCEWRRIPIAWPASEHATQIQIRLLGNVSHDSMDLALTDSASEPLSSEVTSVSAANNQTVTLTYDIERPGSVQTLNLWYQSDIDTATSTSPAWVETLNSEDPSSGAFLPSSFNEGGALPVQGISLESVPSWMSDDTYQLPPVVVARTVSSTATAPTTDWHQVVQGYATSTPNMWVSPPFSLGTLGDIPSESVTYLRPWYCGVIDVRAIEVRELGSADASSAYDAGQSLASSMIGATVERLAAFERATRVYSLFPIVSEDPWAVTGRVLPPEPGDGDEYSTAAWAAVPEAQSGITAYRVTMLVSDVTPSRGGGQHTYYIRPTWHVWDGSTSWDADSALAAQIVYAPRGNILDSQPLLFSRGDFGNRNPRPTANEGRLTSSDPDPVVWQVEIDKPTGYDALLQVEVKGDRHDQRLYVHTIVVEGLQ